MTNKQKHVLKRIEMSVEEFDRIIDETKKHKAEDDRKKFTKMIDDEIKEYDEKIEELEKEYQVVKKRMDKGMKDGYDDYEEMELDRNKFFELPKRISMGKERRYALIKLKKKHLGSGKGMNGEEVEASTVFHPPEKPRVKKQEVE